MGVDNILLHGLPVNFIPRWLEDYTLKNQAADAHLQTLGSFTYPFSPFYLRNKGLAVNSINHSNLVDATLGESNSIFSRNPTFTFIAGAYDRFPETSASFSP